MQVIRIDTKEIVDWDSFHTVFARVFGFPSFYGKNMNAWVDCMTDLDEPESGMSTVHAEPGGVVTIQLDEVGDFSKRVPEIYDALIECSAFVNWRRIKQGAGAVLALSYYKRS